MAVEFTQRVVDAFEATFTASYPAALTAIDATLPGVSTYYKAPVPVIGGGTLHVEFYEGDIEFDEPYTDRGTVNRFRGIYYVRFTLFNRDNASPDEMVSRIRKYASAALNVIRANHTLGDACIINASPQSWAHAWDVDGEDTEKKFKLRGLLAVDVDTQETV